MTDFDPKVSHLRKRSDIDRQDWEALLTALAPDRDLAGQKYEELRRRLTDLLAWEQCDLPESLADEVLNRLSRKIREGVTIPHLDRYAFGIARMVIQEQKRLERSRQTAVREIQAGGSHAAQDWAALEAMQACVDNLPADRRDLIQCYYSEDRVALARRLGISLNALRNRAMRIREELYRCVSLKRDES